MGTFKTFMKKFWNDEEGLGTVELLLIVAVLVAVALLFGQRIIDWVESILDGIGDPEAPTPGGGGGTP
ncbi:MULTISPECIES: Flp1 family type IVb pilin [Bacillaceae]|uniref:Putative Flagellin Flp1-like domain-containing protein n=1 Tax=Evansella alkalicola TaxID=745819 RepID=A0ABS6K078_9BACI|nr:MULTISPECIES: Flp1 family type IVb pilin [Bacillaceae]MBU9724251.1 hypothetical protein [Bacillus alkalicola]